MIGGMVYCIASADVPGREVGRVEAHFADEASVVVLTERRHVERRAKADRRRVDAGAPGGRERRRIRNASGRRVGERRARLVEVDAAPLPKKLKDLAPSLRFVQRVERSPECLVDIEAGRLVVRIHSGEPGAFQQLYNLYFDSVFAYLRLLLRNVHDAEDVTQDVFVRAYQALPSYTLRSQPFRAWLFTVARNAGMSHLRKLGRIELEA